MGNYITVRYIIKENALARCLLSQEKIAEHNVLDAILRLLYLINSVELGQLQETSAGTKEGVDVIVETVTSPDDDDDGVLTNPEGQPLDPSVATPSENVSAMAKEGKQI